MEKVSKTALVLAARTRLCRLLASRLQEDPEKGCWLWTGGCQNPYPLVMVGGFQLKVHRVAACLQWGFDLDNPKRLICHRCDRPRCFNPVHLFESTHRGNMADMRAKGRGRGAPTHCPAGHEYAGENLRIDAKGHRFCRTCDREGVRRHRAGGAPFEVESGPQTTTPRCAVPGCANVAALRGRRRGRPSYRSVCTKHRAPHNSFALMPAPA